MARALQPRIVIDASPAVHHKAGLGRYAEDLIGTLAGDPEHRGDYAVFYHDAQRAEPSPTVNSLPRLTVADSSYRWRLRALLAQLANRSQDALLCGRSMGGSEQTQPGAAPRASPLLFHATEHLLPRFRRVKTVFTLHDLIFQFFPQHHLPRNWIYLQLAMPLFLRRADAVICVSEHTRRDAQRIYHLPDRKLRVIHEGVHPRFRRVTDPASLQAVRLRHRLPERYILAVGTVEPRKNLATLFKAFAVLRRQTTDDRQQTTLNLGLVVVGKQGWLVDETHRAVSENGLTGLVTFTGYVDDQDLPALYSLADAFAFPSVYEGFGLPPLEAMACGAPVVCSNASSLPEIVGDAALLAPPTDVAGWVQALQRTLTDPGLRADLSARGPKKASSYTWAAAAQATRQVYDELLSMSLSGL